MVAGGACVVAGGAFMAKGGVHGERGLHGEGDVYGEGGRGMHGILRDKEIRSISGRYASYWNAFLYFICIQHRRRGTQREK